MFFSTSICFQIYTTPPIGNTLPLSPSAFGRESICRRMCRLYSSLRRQRETVYRVSAAVIVCASDARCARCAMRAQQMARARSKLRQLKRDCRLTGTARRKWSVTTHGAPFRALPGRCSGSASGPGLLPSRTVAPMARTQPVARRVSSADRKNPKPGCGAAFRRSSGPKTAKFGAFLTKSS